MKMKMYQVPVTEMYAIRAQVIMDGTVIPITDKFEVPATSQSEGAFMEYAGDPTAPVGQVANCRCTISAFVMM